MACGQEMTYGRSIEDLRLAEEAGMVFPGAAAEEVEAEVDELDEHCWAAQDVQGARCSACGRHAQVRGAEARGLRAAEQHAGRRGGAAGRAWSGARMAAVVDFVTSIRSPQLPLSGLLLWVPGLHRALQAPQAGN
jgi:hypothetical protein